MPTFRKHEAKQENDGATTEKNSGRKQQQQQQQTTNNNNSNNNNHNHNNHNNNNHNDNDNNNNNNRNRNQNHNQNRNHNPISTIEVTNLTTPRAKYRDISSKSPSFIVKSSTCWLITWWNYGSLGGYNYEYIIHEIHVVKKKNDITNCRAVPACRS